MRKFASAAIAALVFATVINADSTSLVKIAVADFEAHGISASDAASLADRFTAELLSTGKWYVVERSRMAEIFRQAAFEQTWCNDPSCAKAIGKLVAVDKLVLGSVAKVGGIYTVNIRLANVETGGVEKSFSEDCDCGIEELLTATLRRIAYKLSGVSGLGEGAIVSLHKGDASLFVKSVPDSAMVLIDGRIMDGMTPVNIQGLPSGRHDIRVQKGDLVATAIVTLSSNRIRKLSLRMSKQETALKVLTTPSEAEVYIDARISRSRWPDQITPALFNRVKSDSFTVSIFKPGYLDTAITVHITPNKENLISFDLVKAEPALEIFQNKLLKQRSERRLGFRLILGSVLAAAGGGTAVYLAQRDYGRALEIKEILELSVVQNADRIALEDENAAKTRSAEMKSYLGYGLFGAAGAGIAIGMVLYF